MYFCRDLQGAARITDLERQLAEANQKLAQEKQQRQMSQSAVTRLEQQLATAEQAQVISI